MSSKSSIERGNNKSHDLAELEKALAEAHIERQKSLNELQSKKFADAFAKKRQEMFEQYAKQNDGVLLPVYKNTLIENKAVIDNKKPSRIEPSYRLEIFIIILVSLIALVIYTFFSNNQQIVFEDKPSFDCSKAKHKTELEICKEPSLAKLDFENAELFKKATNINATQAKQILNNSVKNRYKCQGDYNCIKSNFQQSIAAYKSIISNLSSQTMPIIKSEISRNVVEGKFTGAWFSINAPSGFIVKPSLKSPTSNIENAFDSAFFISPAGDVEFYIYSPQWLGRPTDFECNSKFEGSPSLEKKGNSQKLFQYSTCVAKDNSYTKSLVVITENQNVNYAFGIKYKNQVAYEKYKADYLRFKNSLKQFSDGR